MDRLIKGVEEKVPAAESPEIAAGAETQTFAALGVLRRNYRDFLAGIFSEVESRHLFPEDENDAAFANFDLSAKGLRQSLEDFQNVLNAVAGESERISLSAEWEDLKAGFLDELDKKGFSLAVLYTYVPLLIKNRTFTPEFIAMFKKRYRYLGRIPLPVGKDQPPQSLFLYVPN